METECKISRFREILVNSAAVESSGRTYKEVIDEAHEHHPNAPVRFFDPAEPDVNGESFMAFEGCWFYREGEQAVVKVPRSTFTSTAMALGDGVTNRKVYSSVRKSLEKLHPEIFGVDKLVYIKTGSLMTKNASNFEEEEEST